MTFINLSLADMSKEIHQLADPKKAQVYSRFFKTGKGEYGDGDVFLGLTVPEQRALAKRYVDLPLKDVRELLYSRYHEFRLTGFFILVYNFQKEERKEIVDFYLQHKERANNWDLIDCVCDKILGKWLLDKDKSILFALARSPSLWDRRIAIISTFEFIRNKNFDDTLQIAESLLHDSHDLIHKAVGWMLREIGKRDQDVLEQFLKKWHKEMPRTMLRYAIERFEEEKRQLYMKGFA
ncbi:MAG TPA: DNA alkylation repair protein [Candidatus Nanoarchaeia archaeon]|nr:DNA alkylation repair protein [Candidatus Nanoarchaeia archaeon]